MIQPKSVSFLGPHPSTFNLFFEKNEAPARLQDETKYTYMQSLLFGVKYMRNLVDFSTAQVLVAGDLMLDKYWHGDVQRISPEAPVPIVKVQKEEHRAGGAANVALNIAKLGAPCACVGVTGRDAQAKNLKDLLEQDGVQTHFIETNHPTITKLRVVSQQQQLIRHDFEELITSNETHKDVLTEFTRSLQKAKAVILSDYNKGTLAQSQQLITACNKAQVPVFVDPKGNDFSRYTGATLLTPNLREFEAVAGKVASHQDLETKALALLEQFNLTAVLVTRGADGMSLIQKNIPPLHIAAHAQEVFDVTGAGDTVIATLAVAIAAGETLENGVKLANLAASIVVSKLGTAFASRQELQQRLFQHQKRFGVVSADELQELVEDAKERGEKVVITNGCFDILHAGHVMYLREARKKGDRLIVAVNSDESVQKLKGPNRPIHSLEYRMELLAALRDVDWVVPFYEETPQALIASLLPHVLVKGGDYKIEEIAGHKEVLNAGGKVEVLGYLDGQSTTQTIAKIKQTH